MALPASQRYWLYRLFTLQHSLCNSNQKTQAVPAIADGHGRKRKAQHAILLEVDPAIVSLKTKLRTLKIKHNTRFADTLEHQARDDFVALFIGAAI